MVMIREARRSVRSEAHEQAAEKREAILKAGLEAFFEHGFKGATIRDIGNRVGLNSASLYYYFPSKRAILLGVMLRGMEELIELARRVVQAAGDSPANQLLELLEAHVAFHGNRRKEAVVSEFELRLLPEEHKLQVIGLRDQYERMIRGILRTGIESGVFRTVDVDLVVRAMIWSCSSVVQWYRPRGRLTLQDIARYYTQLWVKVLLNPNLPPFVIDESPGKSAAS